MEGVSYESASIAGTNGLGKLIYFYDDNHITIDGTTSISFTEDRARALRGARLARAARRGRQRARFAARSDRECSGGDLAAVDRSSVARTSPTARRKAVDTAKAHGSPLGADEVAAAKKALGWDPDKHFFIPDEVARAHEPGRPRQRARDGVERALRAAGRRRSRRNASAGTPRGRAASARGSCRSGRRARSSRRATPARQTMQAFKDAVPTMIGGAADLVESTKTEFVGARALLRQLGRPQHRVRHPRARDGLDRQRHRRARRLREAVRLDVPHLQRLHAAGGAAVGADGAAGRLGVDARLRRARRGRPDAPAGRDVRGAARDPEPLVRAAGRRERDGVGVEGRARAHRRAGCALALAAEGADARPLRPRARVGPRARRVHAVGVGLVARPDPDRDGRRGRARARGGPQARRGRDRRARRVDAVLGALRGAVGRLPRRGAAARGEGAALGRAGRVARLGEVGRRPRRLDLDRAFRRLGAGQRPSSSSSATTWTTWLRARRHCWSVSREGGGGGEDVPLGGGAGVLHRGRAAGGAPRGDRGSARTGMRSRWCRPTGARCRSASRSTRGASQGSKSYEGGGGLRPPRRPPA